MANILRQSTEIKVRVGPFVDATNAVTPETGITLGAADQAELLKANGAATVDISGATWAAVTGAGGWYDLTLTTSHTDTIGELVVVVQDESVCLPVFARFQVVEEEVYDDLFASSGVGYLKPTVAGRDLDVSAGGEAGIDWANIGSPTTTQNLSGTSTKAVEPTVAGRTLDVSAGGEAGVDWANVGSPTTVVNLSGTTVKTATDVETDTQDIQTKIGTPAGASVSADIATVDTVVDAVKAKTDSLTFTIAGLADVNIQRINDVTIVGDGSATPFNV